MKTMEFNGSGGEYFKIWIVNILLTIVTITLGQRFETGDISTAIQFSKIATSTITLPASSCFPAISSPWLWS